MSGGQGSPLATASYVECHDASQLKVYCDALPIVPIYIILLVCLTNMSPTSVNRNVDSADVTDKPYAEVRARGCDMMHTQTLYNSQRTITARSVCRKIQSRSLLTFIADVFNIAHPCDGRTYNRRLVSGFFSGAGTFPHRAQSACSREKSGDTTSFCFAFRHDPTPPVTIKRTHQ